jgi:hypothetical protein
MPHVIELLDDQVASLAACCDAIAAQGFDPRDEGSLHNAALQLRRLGNNRDFLGDILVDQLAARHRDEDAQSNYGPQALVLSRLDQGFFIRANIWPSAQETIMRASGDASFVYGLPHDHNFSFLTHGYFGPGYWSDYYEFDYEALAGYAGEPAGLRFVERARLEPGKLMLYRAHLDVHSQLQPDALSVSLNVMHASGATAWLDQYAFDTERNLITKQLSHGASEAFIRIAVGLGGQEAQDLAHRFARHHPSDRMRLHALDALASIANDDAARDALWRRAEAMGSRLVAMEARSRRERLLN